MSQARSTDCDSPKLRKENEERDKLQPYTGETEDYSGRGIVRQPEVHVGAEIKTRADNEANPIQRTR